ncbi:MAG: glycine dehydrogenase (aminomethyl-transferring), partial [Acidobacteria bacterium]
MNDRLAPNALLDPSDTFAERHLGSDAEEQRAMLAALGYGDLEELVAATVPASIRQAEPLRLSGLDDERPLGEHELLERLGQIAAKNRVFRSLIGMGYADCLVPAVIQRNVLENPGWYTPYTPYQAEISQGRLEALLNFQTLVADLTALPVANASLLDEATAAAEAMTMAYNAAKGRRGVFFAAADCHPQTLAVVETRATGLGIEVVVGDPATAELDQRLCGVLLQYPSTDGRLHDLAPVAERARAAGALTIVACDLLALTLLRPPGAFGADVAVGNSQRFGVPLGYGGPHAAFLACDERLKRLLPGRVIGVSKDARGRLAYRMAMQTREQHIRREKATSNICTAQVLLAIMAGMYAVYHGPEGLRRIARRVRLLTRVLAAGLERLGCTLPDGPVFDTLRVELDAERHGTADEVIARAHTRRINLRRLGAGALGITLDERSDRHEVEALWTIVDGYRAPSFNAGQLAVEIGEEPPPAPHARDGEILRHPVFHLYRTEHEMLRYLNRLERRDLSLTTSMIPLGSCTMKLNATSEMLPVSWPAFNALHPFAPVAQATGYRELIRQLETWLCEITGFDAFSFQPNSGAQGEYSGLMTIRAYHRSRGDDARDVCLIPVSAHGTNPASAVMAGLTVVPVACDERGNVDLADVRAKAAAHAPRLAALMITYPSTHGVFEESIREVCDAIHQAGGQVYLDGANLNAQVGLCRPAEYGADVAHLNLHKTFCIPHGGGGPGMGPIGVKSHLAPFLPTHPVIPVGGPQAFGTVAAAPWGSPSILPISWVYIALMGGRGLTDASRLAILHANYVAHRLGGEYKVLYRGERGRVAHELILDLRPFKKSAGVEAEDVAKRLMDYGFHAPTMSFPVPGTLMIEPTESESKAELDRFCDALLAIREEIRAIEDGRLDPVDNPLKNA